MAYPGIALVAMVGVGLGLALWYLFADTTNESPHGNGPPPPRRDTPTSINCHDLGIPGTRCRRPRGSSKVKECTICTDVLDAGTSGELKCGHIFHNACIMKWCETLSGNNQSLVTCPLCRQAI